MNSVIRCVGAFAVVASLSGCAFNISKYGASVDNVENIKRQGVAHLAVSPFTAAKPGETSITCRAAGPVTTPDGMSFELYVEKAFIDELKLAGVYDANSGVVVGGKLDQVDFNSNIGAGKWLLSLTLSSNKGSPYTVNSTYEFSTNWVADKACQQVAQAFAPAIQKLLSVAIADPRFRALAL